MSKYVSIHNHSYLSLLDGLSSPKAIVSRAKELGHQAIALTDHGTISGVIQFYEECKKQEVKGMLGCEFYVSDGPASVKEKENKANRHLIVIAKNEDGYHDLIRLNNEAAYNFYHNPRIDKEIVRSIASKGNLIGSSACMAGIISSQLFVDLKEAAQQIDKEQCRKFLRPNWLEYGTLEAQDWQRVFAGNFYLEVQDEGMAVQKVIVDCLREISKKSGVPIVCSCDPHFSKPEDAIAHEIIICSQTKKTLSQREEERREGKDILFSDNSGYYIKDYDDIKDLFTEEEIENTINIADSVEDYEIELAKPKLPVFPVPEGFDNVDEFVYTKCNERLIELGISGDKRYTDRLCFEQDIFTNAKVNGISLNNYFAILWDIISEVYRLGSKPGVGRGSAAGCLTSYLLGITRLDPIEYELSFQRFFNTGRLSEGRVSLPDIDLDVSAELRPNIIEYLKNKWGENNVIQIATFGTLQPKAAIKEVFRARGIEFEKANVLTKAFPDAEIKHDDDAKYTIDDALRLSEEFREAMEPYKAELELAKKLEGCIKNRGIHAAGVLVSSEDVNSYLPLSYDARSKTYMCSFEMGDAEKFCVKVDILGLKLLTLFDLCTEKINEFDKNGWPEEKEVEIEPESNTIVEEPEPIIEEKNMEKTMDQIILNYFVASGYEVNKFAVKGNFWYHLVSAGNMKLRPISLCLAESTKNIFADRAKYVQDYVDMFGETDGEYFIAGVHSGKSVYIVDVKEVVANNKGGATLIGNIEDEILVRKDG